MAEERFQTVRKVTRITGGSLVGLGLLYSLSIVANKGLAGCHHEDPDLNARLTATLLKAAQDQGLKSVKIYVSASDPRGCDRTFELKGP